MRRGNFKKLIVPLILVLLLVFIFVKPIQNPTNPISNILSKVINPISGFFRGIGLSISQSVTGLFNDEDEAKMELLKVEIASLRIENRKLQDIINRSEVLEKEYKLLENTNNHLIEAKIVAREPGNWFDLFTINVGEKDGVELNDTVVVAVYGEKKKIIEGLVGKITNIEKDYATVSTIKDESIRVSVRTSRTSEGAIVTSMKSDELEAYMFDRNADVIVGDMIFTSGLGEVFKEGIYVGEVTEVISDESQMKKLIKIKPASPLKSIERVFVVK